MKRSLLCLCLLVSSCHRPTPVAKQAPPPAAPREVTKIPDRVDNVILITLDTLRADYLGYMGGPADTPVLDSLARASWSFDNCIANSMLTNPSHCSIMTSLYPRDHGVYDNESGIPDGVRTLAMAFERQGLRTAAVINFPHLNPEVSNLGTGFQRIIRATSKERRADEISEQALSVLDEFGPKEPFFAWIHYTDPHAPYEADGEAHAGTVDGKHTPIQAAARVAPGFQKNNPWFKRLFRSQTTVEEVVQRYVAEIEATDAGLGVLLDGLRQRKRLARTAIIVTADHGENMGEHNLYFNHGGLYLETVHVPLIISVPGAKPARITDLVESVDIAPTALALVDAPRWEPMRGRNLVEVANGEEPGHEFVFSEHMLGQQVAARSAQGVLILHRKSTRQFPSYPFVASHMEVYDTEKDPDEKRDIGPDGALGKELHDAIQRYIQTGLQLASRPAVNQDRESLRMLGYIE